MRDNGSEEGDDRIAVSLAGVMIYGHGSGYKTYVQTRGYLFALQMTQTNNG